MLRPIAALLIMCIGLLVTPDVLSQQAVSENLPNVPDEREGDAEVEQPERQPIPDDVDLGMVRRSIIIVDDAQRIASERFGGFMGQVDGFFSNAGSDENAVSNGSWARVRIDGVRANGEDFDLGASLKVRAVLPRTERKLKLLVSTEDDDSTEAEDVQNVGTQRSQNGSLALRFIRTARKNSDVNIDLGVRQRDGRIQTFVRLNTRFSFEFGKAWKSRAANSYQHYSKSGFENRLSFDFRRPLSGRDDLYFRTYTEFNWEKGQKGAVIGHTTGFYWQLDGAKALALEGLAGYNTSLNPGVSDRFSGHEFRIRWRDSLGRPWAFYEIWPSIAWPSSMRYEQTFGILLRVEFIIGQRH